MNCKNSEHLVKIKIKCLFFLMPAFITFVVSKNRICSSMKYYLIAGEASGDLHASNLMKALKQRDKQAEFRFFGGDKMAAQGGSLVRHYREMAYMGFLPVLLHARTILKNMKLCRRDILSWRPDVLILVDYAGFNLKMARFVKTHCPDIPVHYYISPKIWAWKSYRIKQFRAYVDKMYIVFPFEKQWFAERNYAVDYVGNPSVDSVSAYLKNASSPVLETALDLSSSKPIIAILPGSRTQEIRRNLPQMLQAAAAFKDDYRIVVSGAPGQEESAYRQYMEGFDFQIVFNQTYALLRQAHAALVVSGTATLETALFDVPQVVCYYMSGGKFLTKLVRKYFIRTPFISLVNLVAGREVVCELVSYECTTELIHKELSLLLQGSERERILQEYARIHQLLGEPGAAEHTADLMLKYLKR